MTNLNYTDLFRQIAEKHKLIAHNESTNPAFVRIVNSTQPVPYLFTQEFMELCNNLQSPFMVLETYDNGFTENQADQKFKIYMGAFLILSTAEVNNQNSIDTALDTCEAVGEDILALLKGLFRTYQPFKGYSFDFSNQNIEKIGPVAQGFWGVRVNIQFLKEYNGPLAYSGVKWNVSGTSGRPQDIITIFAN